MVGILCFTNYHCVLVTGFAVSAHFLGISIMGFAAEKIINPEEVDQFDDNLDIAGQFTEAFKIFSVIFFVFTLFLGIFIPPIPSFIVNIKKDTVVPSETSENWEVIEKENMLREFGTIVDGRAKILNQHVTKMKVSGLDDLFASPVNPGKRGVDARSLVAHGTKFHLTPLIIKRAIPEDIQDKQCRSAIISRKEDLNNFKDQFNEKPVPLLKNNPVKKRNFTHRSIQGMLFSARFWIITLLAFLSSAYGFYMMNNWIGYFSSKFEIKIQNKMFLWVSSFAIASVFFILLGVLISKVTFKWFFVLITLLSAVSGISMDYVVDSTLISLVYLVSILVIGGSQWIVFSKACLLSFGILGHRPAYALLYCILQLSLAVTTIFADWYSVIVIQILACASLVTLPIIWFISSSRD